jgi:septation ring formation regulator EzrA
MDRVDELKKEIADLKKQYNLRSTSDGDKQIITDKIKDLALEIRKLTTTVDQKIVPVLNSDTIADRKTARQSKFLNSTMIRL